MARITCPYCGTRQSFSGNEPVCANCHEEVKPEYIQNARKRPPSWMVTVGYTQHGKTTYLDSLALVLENLSKISPGTFSTHLDNSTFDRLRTIRQEAQDGKLADATQPTQRPDPLLISLPNFLGMSSNTLVINDLPGEIFDSPEVSDVYAVPIRQAETIWFLISLADIQTNRKGRTIAELVKLYVDSMERQGAKPDGRRILVVYTKADRLREELPPSIGKYLATDPYRSIEKMTMTDARENQFDAHAYLDQMYRISEDLREYTFNKVPRGADFISMIEYYKMELSFSIVASVPGADGQTTGIDTPRFRVIDPLIWSLTSSNGGQKDARCALIVDSGDTAERFFQADLPGELFDAIQNMNVDIATYLTGHSKVETEQRPVKAPRRQHLPLIGPIVDGLSEKSFAVVLTDQIPLDLYDYLYTSWHDRIMLVMTEDVSVQWPHKVLYDSDEIDMYDIASDIVSRMKTD